MAERYSEFPMESEEQIDPRIQQAIDEMQARDEALSWTPPHEYSEAEVRRVLEEIGD